MAPTNAASTNQVTLTNIQSLGNLPPVKPGFIAELCLPDGDNEALRRTLSQLVADLKQEPIFGKVDSLSVDRRRNLVDPKILLADRNFALQIELADQELYLPPLLPDPLSPLPAGRDSKSSPRSFRQKLERQVSAAEWEDR